MKKPTKELIYTKDNVRKHTNKQIKALMESVQQFGQYRPIVIDENNNVLAGNGLLMALKALNYKEVEVKQLTGLTESQKRALVIADNRIYELGLNDTRNIIKQLEEIELDDVVGYTSEEVNDLLGETMTEIENALSPTVEYEDKEAKPKKKKYYVCPHCETEFKESDGEVRMKND